jgi:hypothetical protein
MSDSNPFYRSFFELCAHTQHKTLFYNNLKVERINPGSVTLTNTGYYHRSVVFIGTCARRRQSPKEMLAGHQQEIHAERDRKLEAAKEQRKNRRQRAA